METPVSFREALLYWLRLGFVNFGGPAGQIALMHRDLVERRRWISEDRFLHALNFCVLLPGPEAQQLAIYIGWLLHGTPGGIVAGVLFVLPSVFILLALSFVYAAYGHAALVVGLLAGLKPVVLALVANAVIRIGGRALRGPVPLLIAAGAFLAITLARVPFPLVILGAALAGWLGSPPPRADGQPADLSDTIETAGDPVAARASRPWRILAVGAALWVLPLGVLILALGPASLPVAQYRFFTQAAFVTFGGAYAVLAYVNQAAVESLHWITRAQALDGLALAETTPGPLIMVLQFVGFMAGWNHPGGMPPLAAGILGALVTTWTTFLPCFLFIFLGAPHIEALRGNRRLAASLAGVTAAVAGVILNLAVVFGSAVLLPSGLHGGPDWVAVGLAGAALLALQILRLDASWVIAAGAAAGLLIGLAR